MATQNTPKCSDTSQWNVGATTYKARHDLPNGTPAVAGSSFAFSPLGQPGLVQMPPSKDIKKLSTKNTCMILQPVQAGVLNHQHCLNKSDKKFPLIFVDCPRVKQCSKSSKSGSSSPSANRSINVNRGATDPYNRLLDI